MSSSLLSTEFQYVCCTVILRNGLSLNGRISLYSINRGGANLFIKYLRKKSEDYLRYRVGDKIVVFFFLRTRMQKRMMIRTRRGEGEEGRRKREEGRERERKCRRRRDRNLSSKTCRILNNISMVYDIMDFNRSILAIYRPFSSRSISLSSSWTFRTPCKNYLYESHICHYLLPLFCVPKEDSK